MIPESVDEYDRSMSRMFGARGGGMPVYAVLQEVVGAHSKGFKGRYTTSNDSMREEESFVVDPTPTVNPCR